MDLAAIVRRHSLWFGFLAVAVPLGVLLALQYRWLVELDHASAIAHQATLDNYLEAVSAEVEYRYRSMGERALNIPSSLFLQDRVEKAALYFKKKPVDGARRLFAVSFVGEKPGVPLFFDPSCGTMVEPEWSSEVRAVYVASAPWKILAHKGGIVEPVNLAVEERDPEHRIILNPITDETSRLVGLAGMVLDSEHFRVVLLPAVIEKSLPDFFAGVRSHAPAVRVRDGRGTSVLADARAGEGSREDAEKVFSFVFRDWTIGLQSRHATPGEWARTNFNLNVGLSAAIALVLLAGVALALRTASREMKLSQMKSEFVSNVSHELRTPLASIRVFGELLRLGRAESLDKAGEYGEFIETESRRLTQLINNILDFSRIESGGKSYRFEWADVGDVVGETVRTFEVGLRQSGVRIAFDRPVQPLPPVRLDPAAIAQSVSNLLDNAVKYSHGAGDIAVSVRREGSSAVIAVQDHGIGIPRDEQQKIFDRFHRVSTGLVHDIKGSGLGLAIVRHIVRAHGGEVKVKSRPGEGSTFSIWLPLGEELGTRAAGQQPEGSPGPTGGGGRKRLSEA